MIFKRHLGELLDAVNRAVQADLFKRTRHFGLTKLM
jgi:hypothetical protein